MIISKKKINGLDFTPFLDNLGYVNRNIFKFK